MNPAENIKAPFLSKKKNVVIIAILYTFLWGSAFPLVKLCMKFFEIDDNDQASKCLVAGIRFLLSGVLILSLGKVIKIKIIPNNKKSFIWIIIYGIFSTTLQYSFTYIGLSNMDGSKGAIYDQLCVFFILIIGGLCFKDDNLSITKIIGCVIGFVGIFLTSASGLGFDFSLGGEGMMIMAATVQTIAYLIAKKTAKTVNAISLVGLGQTAGGALLCVFSLVFGGKILSANITAVLILIILAGISSSAYILSVLPLKYFPATEIASFNLLIPIFGVIMSGIILQEDIFKWNYPVALILISLGIFIINYSFKFKKIKNDTKEIKRSE